MSSEFNDCPLISFMFQVSLLCTIIKILHDVISTIIKWHTVPPVVQVLKEVRE